MFEPSWQERARELRRQHWLKLTGLLPPDERDFVPRTEDEPVFVGGGRRLVVGTPARCHQVFRKALPGDPGPSWDDVVRAYEEDR